MRELNYPKTVQVRMPFSDVEKIDRVREPLELSRSMMIRQAVREFLERQLAMQTKSATDQACQ